MWKFLNKTFLFIYVYSHILYFYKVCASLPVYERCGKTIQENRGIIQSPNYPGNYPPNSNCILNIQAFTITSRMTLRFSDFYLEGGANMNCEYDSVEVISLYPGILNKSARRYGLFCEGNSPGTIVAYGQSFRIIFKTNHRYQHKGFRAEYLIEKDECFVNNGGCQHTCQNSGLTYKCSCRPGYSPPHNNSPDCVQDKDYIQRINPGINNIRKTTLQWIKSHRRNMTGNLKWGNEICRIAISLYLVDSKYFEGYNSTGNEISYEVDNFVVSNLLRNKTNPASETELATYIQALLVTCQNPRNFHGINLVSHLRSLINGQRNYTSPFIMLALCNANEEITKLDIEKVISAFNNAQRSVWTSTESLALMALSCMIQRSENSSEWSSVVKEMALKIMGKQLGDGSFDNVYTTALAMQAIFASGNENDTSWNVKNAVDFLINGQMDNGSYGNFLNTFYALPALYHTSFINISSSHCRNKFTDGASIDLNNANVQHKKEILVKYSLWFGNHLDVIKCLIVRAKENCTFFDIMNLAEPLDPQYKFDYVMPGLKPYVYSLNGLQEDPENEMFWLVYRMSDRDTEFEAINLSPVDMYPKHRDEYIMWYRKGDWNREIDKLLKDRVALMETQEFEDNYDNTSLSKYDETLNNDEN